MMPTESELRATLNELADEVLAADPDRLLRAVRAAAGRQRRGWPMATAAAAAVVSLVAVPIMIIRGTDNRAASVRLPAAPSTSSAKRVSPPATPPRPPASASTASLPTNYPSARSVIGSGQAQQPANFQTGSWDLTTAAIAMPSVVQFSTPSRNIRCTFDNSGTPSLMCTIDAYTFAAPSRPADCALNWVPVLIDLAADGAVLGQCVGGPQVTYHSRVLGYGQTLSSGGISCASEPTALTCAIDSTQHGFSLNRQGVRRF